MRTRLLALALGLAAAAAGCSPKGPAWTQPPPDSVGGDATVSGQPAPVRRFAAAPKIDGKLDDAAWSSATALGPFVDPGQGEADRSKLAGSFARIGWDDKALYLGFAVPDEGAISPFGRTEVDPHIWERSSAVELMLQPGDPGDNRDYYELQFDIDGAVFDTHWDDYNRPIVDGPGGKVFGHMDWASQAERAVSLDKSRYSLEVALPWASLLPGRVAIPPKPGDVWRLNLYAFRDGQSVANAWSPIKRQGNFHKSSRWGRVKFE
jgi:hypothetical protein